MDEKTAEDIYWVLTDKHTFIIQDHEESYWRLKVERVKISTRYYELKATHSFSDAQRIATIEWLIDYEKRCQEKQ